ncbi:MAG: pyridoxamine 5'-phosphate oxidase [Actinobacteria bacterium]|nr:MAG: pyridoxamine 5'-phosphate oxidase [Actinomycetota bacterium]TML20792.1 MAG: pyridoxamine 5'-phosphate oxidase [Actinomycetota bacterium]
MTDPRPTAPRMPAAYGVPTDASGAELLPWSWAVERLVLARNYWICTTRADGRPHAAPVWGLWLDEALWFSTSPESQKGRNLARNPTVLVHLESGDDVVILEGEAEPSRDADALARFVDAYEAKYDYRVDLSNSDTPIYVVRPRIAQTWAESGFPRAAVRWLFD